MRKYLLAIAIASGALISLSVQAAPVSSAVSGVQNQVTGDAVKVYHCRGWSGGWHCGGGGGWGHGRYWSHRRWGSGGWGGGWGHGRHWSHRRHGSWDW